LIYAREDDSGRLKIRNKYSFGDRFVAMYMGAHGAYNALDTIIDAALMLRDDPRFLFVFVGDGDEKPKLQKRVSDHLLTNVIFLPPMPRIELPQTMLSAADAFVLPNRKGRFFMLEICPINYSIFLASCKACCCNAGAGETPELVKAAGAGKV
jgi:colanic acid biosynthesis glycosyl transferase WcaI